MRLITPILAMMLCATALPAAAQDEESSGPWTVSGGAWVLSDYVWRGVSQTQENPAFQGELSVAHESGFYVGAWTTTVDFTAAGAEDDGIDYELDGTIGWAGDLSDSLSLDVYFTRIIYPGFNEGYNYNFNEFTAELGFAEHYTAGVVYSDDAINLGGSGIYYKLAGDWDLGDSGFSLGAAVGHYDLSDALDDSYSDYLVSLSRSFGPVNASLMFTDTSGYSDVLAEGLGDASLADGRVALQVGVEF